MRQNQRGVPVKIMDREYIIACAPDEREAVLASAELLNSRISELRGGGRVIGADRLLALTALNLANELMSLRSRSDEYRACLERVDSLQERMQAALDAAQEG